MVLSLRRALRKTTLLPSDEATVALAREYARRIDDGDLSVGSKFLTTLQSLLMTPQSRAIGLPKKGAPDAKPANNLDQLRAKRTARLNNAPAVDATATASDA